MIIWQVLLTILGHWLSERRSNAKDNASQDVLEAGEQEQRCVLRIHNIALVLVELRR
jgi:hypothetical protein